MIAYLVLFCLGLCIGSFLNVIIYREVKGKSWAKGRSYCDSCKKKLLWYDNIPLLSFVFLQGRCRWCRKKISLQYPLVEFLTGLEFVLIYWFLKDDPLFFIWLGLAAVGTTILVADLRFMIIPDTAIVGGLFLAILAIWLDYSSTGIINFSFLWSGIGASLFFLSLVLVTRSKGMGWGDVKLAGLMGLVLGFPKILLALFFSFLTGAILGVILIVSGRKKLKSQIAFGPFLILGSIFGLVFGEKILNYYLRGC